MDHHLFQYSCQQQPTCLWKFHIKIKSVLTDFSVFSLLRLQIDIVVVAGPFCEPLTATAELGINRQALADILGIAVWVY